MVDGHLIFDTKFNSNGFKDGIKNISKSLGALKSTVESIGSAIGITFSPSSMINYAKSAKEAYNVQLEAETKLETVLGKHLDATQEQIDATKEWASQLQELGVIGDEIQLSGLQELSTYIGNPDSLKKMNVVLNDMLAQQYGFNATAESAVTISTMLGKVLEGQTSALSRYGYSFTEAQEQLLKYGTEEERVATLAEVVEASVGGMNEALANTPAGRIKQVENTMGDIKEQFGEVVTQLQVLFLPALRQVADALQYIAQQAGAVTSALAGAFGVNVSNAGSGTANLAEDTSQLESGAEAAAESYGDMAEAAREAEQANKGSLAAFDELNVLSQQENSETGTQTQAQTDAQTAAEDVSSGVETFAENSESALIGLINRVKSAMQSLFEPMKRAWNTYGRGVIDSAKRALESVKNVILDIGGTFADVWTSGSGERICGNILAIVTSINDTAANLAENFREAWNTGNAGQNIVQSIFDIIENITEHARNIGDSIRNWSANVDFLPSLQSFKTLLDGVKSMLDLVGDGAENFINDIVLPLAGWTIEAALPAALDAIGAFLELVSSIGEVVVDTLHTLWEQFFSKIADFVGDTIVTVVEAIAGFMHDVAENQTAVTTLVVIAEVLGTILGGILLIQNALTAFRGISAVLTTMTTPSLGLVALAIGAIIVVIIELITYWDEIKEAVQIALDFWKSKLDAFVQWFTSGWSQFANGWTNKVTNAINAVKNAGKRFMRWFTNGWSQFANAWTNKVRDLWNGLKTGARNAWNGVKSVFSNVATYFGNIFSNAWEKVKDVFSAGGRIFNGITEGIFDSFRNIVNSLIDGINSVVAAPFNAINDALAGIQEHLPIISLPTIDVPQIPHLATGTVIPAGFGEFAAILGDNRREPEVVSPVSAMKQAFKEALAESDLFGENTINLDGEVLYKAMRKRREHFNRMHGGRAAFGGA